MEKTKKAKRTAIVAKEQPMAASNALSQQSLITVEERTKIAELRQLVNEEKEELLSTDALKMYCSDAQLARNLRARKWDVLKAFEMLKKTLFTQKQDLMKYSTVDFTKPPQQDKTLSKG